MALGRACGVAEGDGPVSGCVVAELLLSWIDWVEVEAQGFPELMEELRRLRGAVMLALMIS